MLVFTTLYPNPGQPHHGVFVENRLRHLLATSGYRASVIAPVPWVPPGLRGHPRYQALTRVPVHEVRHELDVWHPRYPVIPKVGMTAAPALLYAAARRQARALMRAGDRFDLIDAHYFYPDGVAAALLARELGLPFTVTGRGTDLNLIPRYTAPRRMIRWTAARAAGLITVCDALRQDLAGLGVDPGRVQVLRNGVDLATFWRDAAGRARWRTELGLGEAPVVASVGHLIARKGHDLAIRALAGLAPDTHLLIAGTGPEETALRTLAGQLGVSDRVHFLGAVPHDQLRAVYSAADALVLASSREGWPNVLLESLACGTPVVATSVNGTPEVVRDPVAGRVVAERTPEALTGALATILAAPSDPMTIRAYAESFSWAATSRGQIEIFEGLAQAASATAALGFAGSGYANDVALSACRSRRRG
nr:glycosyltransferase family 4 protein [Rhodovibrio salinarum]